MEAVIIRRATLFVRRIFFHARKGREAGSRGLIETYVTQILTFVNYVTIRFTGANERI